MLNLKRPASKTDTPVVPVTNPWSWPVSDPFAASGSPGGIPERA
jgi:hypothetical protein